MSWFPQINLFYHRFLCLPVFLFSTTLGSRSLLGFLRPTLPAAPNETEPGSKTLVASLWEQLYLKNTLLYVLYLAYTTRMTSLSYCVVINL